MKGDHLTIKQEQFCLEYAKTGNATLAYIHNYGREGKKMNEAVAASNAWKLLRNEKVKARLAELAEENRSAKIADMREAQERLTAIARRLETEEVILADGSEISKKAAIRDALKAWELLGKMQGAFLDRQQVEVNGQISVSFVDDVHE